MLSLNQGKAAYLRCDSQAAVVARMSRLGSHCAESAQLFAQYQNSTGSTLPCRSPRLKSKASILALVLTGKVQICTLEDFLEERAKPPRMVAHLRAVTASKERAERSSPKKDPDNSRYG